MNNSKQPKPPDKIVFSPGCCRFLFTGSRVLVTAVDQPRTPVGNWRGEVPLPATDFRFIMYASTTLHTIQPSGKSDRKCRQILIASSAPRDPPGRVLDQSHHIPVSNISDFRPSAAPNIADQSDRASEQFKICRLDLLDFLTRWNMGIILW